MLIQSFRAFAATVCVSLLCQSSCYAAPQFQAPVYHDFANIGCVCAGDLNNDTFPDVIGGSYTGTTGQVGILTGSASGALQPGGFYDAANVSGSGFFPMAAAIADVTGDGKMDILSANSTLNVHVASSDLSVFVGNGDATFQPGITYPVALGNPSLYVYDFDGDGDKDVAVSKSNGLGVAMNSGTGQFPSVTLYPSTPQWMGGAASLSHVMMSDFNNDGVIDIAAATMGGTMLTMGGIDVFIGNADGTFQPVRFTSTKFTSPGGCAAGDLNGDGNADIAAMNQSATQSPGFKILLGNGAGTFPTILQVAQAGCAGNCVIVDIDKDGDQDVIAPHIMLLNDGSANFSASAMPALSFTPARVSVADLDSNNTPDLLFAGSGQIAVVLGESSAGCADWMMY